MNIKSCLGKTFLPPKSHLGRRLKLTYVIASRKSIGVASRRDFRERLSDTSIDRVLCMNVMYFLDPLNVYLGKVHRILKPAWVLRGVGMQGGLQARRPRGVCEHRLGQVPQIHGGGWAQG